MFHPSVSSRTNGFADVASTAYNIFDKIDKHERYFNMAVATKELSQLEEALKAKQSANTYASQQQSAQAFDESIVATIKAIVHGK
jgi:hypothetical protein